MKILIADDESSLRLAVRLILEKQGHDVCEASDGLQALTQMQLEHPDLVILDVTMPKLNGLDVCSAIRDMGMDVPIIILSAKGATDDRVRGLKSGADDYLPKPFSEEELLLRVDSLGRRSRHQGATDKTNPVVFPVKSAIEPLSGEPHASSFALHVGDLTIDFKRCIVQVGEEPVRLTPREFQILTLLAEEPGVVFSREEIIERVWGPAYLDGSISIPTYIRHIREKIEENPGEPKRLQTISRFGYRLEP